LVEDHAPRRDGHQRQHQEHDLPDDGRAVDDVEKAQVTGGVGHTSTLLLQLQGKEKTAKRAQTALRDISLCAAGKGAARGRPPRLELPNCIMTCKSLSNLCY